MKFVNFSWLCNLVNSIDIICCSESSLTSELFKGIMIDEEWRAAHQKQSVLQLAESSAAKKLTHMSLLLP